ncbi:MAG: DUF2520 domain-containing protein [Ferruginibacter sp.]|nr:DUF2520 domain-containing protein [Ferruginibacter sp.]
MRIALVGTGNIATTLGRLIQSKGHHIVHVAGHTLQHAQELAVEMGCSYSEIKDAHNAEADIYIIAVSDYAIQEVANQLHINPAIAVHTAGAESIHILKNISSRYGVLYPLQSLRKEINQIPEIPFLIDGNTMESLVVLKNFADSLSNNVTKAGDEERLRLHTAAVIVSNFTNHLYDIAESFCKGEQVDFNLLKPLIMETAKRITVDSPHDVQTGPAIRKDVITMDKHLRLLSAYPKIRTLYLRITDSIMNP